MYRLHKSTKGSLTLMNDKFFDLKKEKQDRIINAALKFFSLNGYKFASTDEIVKEAGISKGLLFHYFESKLGIYSFLYDYSARYTILELKSTVDEHETDFFEIMRQVEFAKFLTMRSHPHMQLFLHSCEKEDIVEALAAVSSRKTELNDLYDQIFSRMSSSSLKSGCDIERLKDILQYAIYGTMSDCFKDPYGDPSKLSDEINAIIQSIEILAKNTSAV